MRVWIGTVMIGIVVLGTASCTSGGRHVSGGNGLSTSTTSGPPPVTSTPPAPSTPSTPGTSPAPSTSGTPSTSRAPSTSRQSTSGLAACHTTALELAQGRAEGTAGSVYVPYYLRNRSAAACTLTGFPGFALLDAHGAIIQRPAKRVGPHYSTVTLRPGGRVQFIVRTIDPGIPGTGCSSAWLTATVQVYPPNETTPLREPSGLQACDLSVGPVESVL